eukprot:TRINITY_DN685_c0_g1_i2.p1 TRINITY_DN685_c0_g1~~TRINITY_DN685_c0_g1_i2.p1  ORF type:complete len:184 (-),score=28.66 TRINITY_DN685_c0_g1_i2:49-600(-)
MFKFLLLLSVFLTVTFCSSRPNLLVHKAVLTKPIVVDSNVTIALHVFNLGTKTAYDIVLEDKNIPETWEHQLGLQTITWDQLAPGENFTHVYVVKPTTPGIYDILPATISYREDPSKPEVRVGYSSSYPKSKVWHAGEVDRRGKSYLKEWALFVLFSGVSMLVPGFVYTQIQLNYEDGIPKRA